MSWSEGWWLGVGGQGVGRGGAYRSLVVVIVVRKDLQVLRHDPLHLVGVGLLPLFLLGWLWKVASLHLGEPFLHLLVHVRLW